MIGPIVQITVMVALTHGFRALERRFGPRRSGLLMGLPSTTALTLVGCGLEGGVEEAIVASETCLIGLVAAISLPVSYARAVAAGSPISRAAASSVLNYVLIALGLWWLPRAGPGASALTAASGLAVACHLAGRVSRVSGLDHDGGGAIAGMWTLAGRTAVPVVYVALIRTIRASVGSAWSGRFITFPGGSLALLVTTHLERGPGPAFRMAVSMPAGGLGTFAFLLAFRFGCPGLGLRWGTAGGYAAAFLALVLAELFGRTRPWRETVAGPCLMTLRSSGLELGKSFFQREHSERSDCTLVGSRFTTRRFSPGLEFLAG